MRHTRRHGEREDGARPQVRSGFTLIEVIIAIIVMAIGVMGLAGTASFVTQQMGGGNMQTIAASMSAKVADSLSSRRCSALVDGTQTSRGVTVRWTIEDSSRTRWVRQAVQYRPKRGPAKTVNYVVVVQCPD